MLSGKSEQIIPTSHGAIFVQDLDNYRSQLKACQPSKIATGLGMACSGQNPARLSHEGENMPRLTDIFRLGVRRHRSLHCASAISRRNTGRDTGDGFYGKREVGGMLAVRAVDHQRQP